MGPITNDADPLDGTAEELRSPRDPLRRCIVTGTVQPKIGMIRFVVGPNDDLVPDILGTLPGRGMWLTADRAVMERALARKVFAKAARRPVRASSDLVDRVVALLERHCLDLIGLARRAGQALAGFEKVAEALRAGRVCRTGVPGLLLAASDGAADGRSKLRALSGGLPIIEEFQSAALAAALGREHAVHALLARGTLTDRLRVDANRLASLRGELRILPAGRPPAGQPINDGPVGQQ
ncbi:MAG: RNA-binding protein [Rhodospirillaceae bacterium]